MLVLTDRSACARRGRGLVETVELAVAAGARAVVLREKDMPRAERRRVADRLRRIVPVLIVASDVSLAHEVGADGVHLAADDPMPAAPDRRSSTTSPGGAGDAADDPFVAGRSCHGGEDVENALREGAAYATLSPVFRSISKPGYGPAIDLDELGGHALPVYALGGIEPGRAGPCLAAGAAGIAVMGAVMGATDPGGVIAALVDEMELADHSPALRSHGRGEGRWAPTGRFGPAGAHRSAREDQR